MNPVKKTVDVVQEERLVPRSVSQTTIWCCPVCDFTDNSMWASTMRRHIDLEHILDRPIFTPNMSKFYLIDDGKRMRAMYRMTTEVMDCCPIDAESIPFYAGIVDIDDGDETSMFATADQYANLLEEKITELEERLHTLRGELIFAKWLARGTEQE